MAGLNINSTTITGYDTSYNLKINNGSVDCLQVDTTDRTLLPNQPAFIAGSNNTTNPTNFTANTWNIIPCNVTSLNVGLCYNTSTYKFTAPVTGTYIFIGCLYIQSVDNSYYLYPLFSVNSSSATRHPTTTAYRVRGRDTSYDDGQIQEVYSLVAGDFVQFLCYTINVSTYYPQYSYFAGCLIG